MTRNEIILALIDLDNKSTILFQSYHKIGNPELWNVADYEYQPDRYYLVESAVPKSWDSDKDTKVYEPKVELRKLLRSKEANKYGRDHEAYFKRYLRTGQYTYSEIENPKKYLMELEQQLIQTFKKETV